MVCTIVTSCCHCWRGNHDDQILQGESKQVLAEFVEQEFYVEQKRNPLPRDALDIYRGKKIIPSPPTRSVLNSKLKYSSSIVTFRLTMSIIVLNILLLI